jgi:hypothetical protein
VGGASEHHPYALLARSLTSLPSADDEQDPTAFLAGETAFHNPAARHEDPDNLGERTDDWRYYWSAHVNTYRQPEGALDVIPDIHVCIHWWQTALEIYLANGQVHWHSQGIVDRLVPEQRLIYDPVTSHYRTGGPPLLLNVDGRAGTGKSFIIQVMSAHLTALSNSSDTVLRTAPTGAASFGITGSTIQSLLKLPINKPIEILRPGLAQSIQARLACTRYLIIDEKSMMSPETLFHIDFRLQQAFGNRTRFGGISIILFGDFWQLPPIKDKALYQSELITSDSPPYFPNAVPSQGRLPHNKAEFHPAVPLAADLLLPDRLGIKLYEAFNRSIEIVVQQRQDASQVAFTAALEGLRNSRVTREH